MHLARTRRLGGYAYMAVAALTWGSLPMIVDRAGGDAVALVAMRMGFGGLALGGSLLVFGRAELVPKTHRGLIVVMGLLLSTSWVLFFSAIQHIGATAVLIGYLFPVIVALAAPAVLGEPRGRHVLPLAFVGLIGIACIIAPQIRGGDVVGVLFALGVALESTCLILAARRVVQHVPGPVIAFWENVIGVTLLAPLALVVSSGGGQPWAWGLLIGVVHTAITGVFFFRAVGRITAPEAGIIMYLEPVSAVAYVWMIDAIAPSAWDVLGGALVIAAGIGLVGAELRKIPIASSLSGAS